MQGLGGAGLASNPSLQHSQSGSGGAQRPPSKSKASCSAKPVADPPLVKKQKRTALEPGRAPKRQRSTLPLERGTAPDSASRGQAPARPPLAGPMLGSTSSQAHSAPAAAAALRPSPAPAQFVIGIPSPQQPAGRPATSAAHARPVPAQTRLAPPTSSPALQPAMAQPPLAQATRGLPALQPPMSLSALHIPAAVSLDTGAARQPHAAMAGAQQAMLTPAQDRTAVKQRSAVQADRESAAQPQTQASLGRAGASAHLPSQGERLSYGDWLVRSPRTGVEVDVRDMQRPFLDPSAMASLAESGWNTGMAADDTSPPGLIPFADTALFAICISSCPRCVLLFSLGCSRRQLV